MWRSKRGTAPQVYGITVRGRDRVLEVHIYEPGSVSDELLMYAVIMARHNERWIFVRNKNRSTWEVPGGRREPEESIAETARRELVEETGAEDFHMTPVCIYCVNWEGAPSYGQLFFADVDKLGRLPDLEIGELALFEDLPERLTYPEIQGELFAVGSRFHTQRATDNTFYNAKRRLSSD